MTIQQKNLTKLLESEMGNLSDDRLPMSYIDDFSLGDIAYGAYTPFDTNIIETAYMDDFALGAVVYQGTWEDENGLGFHGRDAGITPTIVGTVAAPLPTIQPNGYKPAIVKSDPVTMIKAEEAQKAGANQMLLWGGLGLAALLFLG